MFYVPKTLVDLSTLQIEKNIWFRREVTKALIIKAKVVLPSENTTSSIYRIYIKNEQFKSKKTNVFSTRHPLVCDFLCHMHKPSVVREALYACFVFIENVSDWNLVFG